MNTHHLEIFCRLAEVEHYGQVSEEFGIAQPSLSRIIHRLEEELAVPLFEPVGRNVRLSKAGRMYYPRVKQSLETLDKGMNEILDFVDPLHGTIDLGFIFSIGPEIVPNILQTFRNIEANQQFQFRFWQGNTPRLIRFLHNEICDYALCSYLKDQPEIAFTHLFDQELVAIVANDHLLAQKECIDFAELANVPMVLTRDKTFYIENLFRQQKIPLVTACHVEEDQSQAGLVSVGFGAAILPYNELMAHFDISVLRFTVPLVRPVYLAEKKGIRLNQAANTFLHFLKTKDFQEKKD